MSVCRFPCSFFFLGGWEVGGVGGTGREKVEEGSYQVWYTTYYHKLLLHQKCHKLNTDLCFISPPPPPSFSLAIIDLLLFSSVCILNQLTVTRSKQSDFLASFKLHKITQLNNNSNLSKHMNEPSSSNIHQTAQCKEPTEPSNPTTDCIRKGGKRGGNKT